MPIVTFERQFMAKNRQNDSRNDCMEDRTEQLKKKKLIWCWLFLLCCIGILILIGKYEIKYEKSIEQQIYAAYDEEIELQKDISDYEKELEALDRKYVEDISAKTCVILCFDDFGNSAYGDIIKEMDKRGMVGVIVFRDGKVPGKKGSISVELYQELLEKGWEGAIGNSKEILVYRNFPDKLKEKWKSYIQTMQNEFVKNGLEIPRIYIPHEKENVEEIEDLLVNYQMTGYTTIVENIAKAATAMNIDSMTNMGTVIGKYYYNNLGQDIKNLIPNAESVAILFRRVESGAPRSKINTSVYMLRKQLERLSIFEAFVNVCTFSEYQDYQNKLVNQNMDLYHKYLNDRNKILSEIISLNKEIMDNFEQIFQ